MHTNTYIYIYIYKYVYINLYNIRAYAYACMCKISVNTVKMIYICFFFFRDSRRDDGQKGGKKEGGCAQLATDAPPKVTCVKALLLRITTLGLRMSPPDRLVWMITDTKQADFEQPVNISS